MLSNPLIDGVKKVDLELFESHLSGDSRINARSYCVALRSHEEQQSFAILLIEKKVSPNDKQRRQESLASGCAIWE